MKNFIMFINSTDIYKVQLSKTKQKNDHFDILLT